MLTSCNADSRYEVITTPTDVVMVMEYAGEELFNYIVDTGKGGVGPDVGIRLTLDG
jgi:predicted thioesterase